MATKVTVNVWLDNGEADIFTGDVTAGTPLELTSKLDAKSLGKLYKGRRITHWQCYGEAGVLFSAIREGANQVRTFGGSRMLLEVAKLQKLTHPYLIKEESTIYADSKA